MLSALFNGLKNRRRSMGSRLAAKSRRPLIESMEDRRLLSTTPMMVINSPTVTEGPENGGTKLTFTVSMTSATSNTVKVNYQTLDRTAKVGSDYVAKRGQLTFAPGETTQTITVDVIGDSVIEQTEVFYVMLSGATNARVIQSIGVGTVLDDDTPVEPEISINNVSMYRGLDNFRYMTFSVSLNTAVNAPVSVTASTRNVTAVAGQDYDAKAQTLTFQPGQTTAQFTVKIYGTSTLCSDKLFYVDLTNSNLPLKIRTGVGILRYGA